MKNGMIGAVVGGVGGAENGNCRDGNCGSSSRIFGSSPYQTFLCHYFSLLFALPLLH